MDERPDRPAEEPRADAVAPEQTPAGDDTAALRAQLERVRAEADRNWQQFLHAAADLENYKKQAARQRDDAVQRTRAALLALVLDVVDNLERALGHGGAADPGAVQEGIRIAHRQVVERLQGLGVQPIEARGRPFDPRFHEAIDVTPADAAGTAPGTVVDEIQRGYLLNGEVLRPARVRVAK
ncbi:MAG TPA: nucleotide exchange factor GrpE [bacterium]|nr:nucleotide exchange factor GrpE [bacterium]